jgi:ABC-type multidrug transport system fused ATPase/permease subunit
VDHPAIIIFDEANAAIDSQSEELIWKALESEGRQRLVFVVSHRLASLHHADYVLLLQHGKLATMGTHSELLNHPLYCDLFERQLSGTETGNIREPMRAVVIPHTYQD